MEAELNSVDLFRALLTSPVAGPLLDAGNWLLYQGRWRRPLLQVLERRLAAALAQGDHVHPAWHVIAHQRTLILAAILRTVDRVIEQRLLSPQVARTITELWGRALCSADNQQAVQRFRQERGCDPPWFLVLAPGHACNLGCSDCYASSGPAHEKLPWSTLDRILTEAKQLWGIQLFVFSGGEPLLYRSEGKDLLDLVEKHADCLFLMFSNGTLIDPPTVARLKRLGNLTPALSVEGMRARTDHRRGVGLFDRTLAAMASLREAGVPFGISATVTRANCREILSDEFLDLFFAEQGAFYGFLFQYAPIGRSANLALVPTPAQATRFWRRSWEVVATKRLFLLDFGNHGPLVEGCISAGREKGYLYIDWNGNVMPCVFAPYSAANIHEVYAQGGTLNDVWELAFFRAVRKWQRDYGYGREKLTAENNWLRPCPFRNHHPLFRQWIEQYQLEPEDEAAQDTLDDPAYYEAMVACSARHEKAGQELWENEYLSPSGPIPPAPHQP